MGGESKCVHICVSWLFTSISLAHQSLFLSLYLLEIREAQDALAETGGYEDDDGFDAIDDDDGISLLEMARASLAKDYPDNDNDGSFELVNV